MEKKINVAELLKDCPKGMELNCTMYDNLYFDRVEDDFIHCYYELDGFRNATMFLKDGCYTAHRLSKCVIFPKGKTTWEGFQRPFKDGDIIFTHANCLKVGLGNTWISIYQENRNGGVATYVDCADDGNDYYSNIDEDKPLLCMEKDIMRQRFATEEEKLKLFQAINDHGYKWNSETKTLEELIEPKFKVGDEVLINDDKNDICIADSMAWHDVYTVKSMAWHEDFNRVVYKIEAVDGTIDKHECFAHEMVFFNHKKEESIEEKLEQITLDIPDGYEFFGINDNNKVVLTKQTQYPKTYEECCDVLNIAYPYFDAVDYCICASSYKNELFGKLKKLLICRDAYWKIAGGWEEKRKEKAMHYVIYSTLLGEVVKDTMPNCIANYLLDFPTEEMRDAFFENFTELIENCKELL